MRCENSTRFYIDDFVEDLNYRKIILSFDNVDPEKLKSRLKKDDVNHMYCFDDYCTSNKLFYIENCDLQEVDTRMDSSEIYGNSFQSLVIEQGYSVVALHYDDKGDQWYFDIDVFVDRIIES